jgi:hypothetical protein
MIIYSQGLDDTIRMADWCASRLNEPLEAFGFNRTGRPLFECMGFARDNKLLCVVVLYHKTTNGVFCSFAADSPRWASKENVAAWGHWIFNQMGLDRVTATIKKSNKRSRKFVEGVGFRVEGKLRKAVNGEDMIVYGLLKEEHDTWLRKAFNVERKHTG